MTALNADLEGIRQEEKIKAKEAIEKAELGWKEADKKRGQELDDVQEENRRIKEELGFYRKESEVLLSRN